LEGKRGKGRLYGTSKLEEVGNGLKIDINPINVFIGFPHFSTPFIPTPPPLPYARTDINDTMMAISAATLYNQGSLSSQLPANSDPLIPKEPAGQNSQGW
jgi:hypothetical protein